MMVIVLATLTRQGRKRTYPTYPIAQIGTWDNWQGYWVYTDTHGSNNFDDRSSAEEYLEELGYSEIVIMEEAQ